MYHTVFGSENKVSVVDSLIHLSRIPPLLWQYPFAQVTPLTSVELYFPSRGKPMALSAPSSFQLALLCQFKGNK